MQKLQHNLRTNFYTSNEQLLVPLSQRIGERPWGHLVYQHCNTTFSIIISSHVKRKDKVIKKRTEREQLLFVEQEVNRPDRHLLLTAWTWPNLKTQRTASKLNFSMTTTLHESNGGLFVSRNTDDHTVNAKFRKPWPTSGCVQCTQQANSI